MDGTLETNLIATGRHSQPLLSAHTLVYGSTLLLHFLFVLTKSYQRNFATF